jgi:tetratricopeptide (TPR) repeat protein
VHTSNTARLEQSFREIADQVRIRGRKDPHVDVFKLVHDWLRDEKNGPWLLVLDNADDAAVLSPQPSNSQQSHANDGDSSSALRHHLSTYLPPSRHGSVLVTSRTRRAAIKIVEDSNIILIAPMHDAAAHTLLHKKLGDKANRGDDITELAIALEHMPLALVQAAAYIRERWPRCSVQQYLEEYRQSDSRKTSLLNHEAGHLRRDEAASNSVLITWQLSFDYIRSRRQSAADLLSLMSFFDPQGIHEGLLRSQTNTANETVSTVNMNSGFDDDVLTLRDYSLITVTKNANTFEMHNLIQLATRKWLENHGEVDKWRGQFIFKLCAKMPNGEHENWEKCQALFPHAKVALAQRPKDKESLKEWALILYNAAWYAWQRGRVGEAVNMSVISAEVRSEILGEGSVETLSSVEMVGLAMSLGGRWKEAESMNRETLAWKEKVLGPNHLNTLVSMNNLADVLNSQGKYEEAELMNRQALARMEKVLGPDHPLTLTSMGNLALVLDGQGKYEEAELMNRQTLARKEKVLGPEHPDTLTSMSNLALVLNSQGKYEEAELMNRQTLARREKLLGPEHPDTLTSMSNLAGVLDRQGRYEEVELMDRQTLARKEKVLGPKHPDTLTSMSNLALVLNSQGKYKEAELMNRQTLARIEKVLGPEHPDTLTSMSNLALVLNSQGKYEEAELMNRQTLARREKVLGPKHPDTLASVYSLAHILGNQHCYSESLALYERAYSAYHTVLGEDHPTTRACRQHFATAKKHSKEEQSESAGSTVIPDSDIRIQTGKVSKLARSLAKIGIRISKTSTL